MVQTGIDSRKLSSSSGELGAGDDNSYFLGKMLERIEFSVNHGVTNHKAIRFL